MPTPDDKASFLKKNFVSLIKQIRSDTLPAWGKMTLQQMVEHFSDALRIASAKVASADIITPDEKLQKMRDFLMTDKPFKENTTNPLMPQVPPPVRNKTINDAFTELQNEIDYFFTVFEKNNLQLTRNPFFGDLNYDQNVQLLYKHALHHLRQFGLIIS